jgi:hypothetical protein
MTKQNPTLAVNRFRIQLFIGLVLVDLYASAPLKRRIFHQEFASVLPEDGPNPAPQHSGIFGCQLPLLQKLAI